MGNALLKLCASCGGEDTPARITAAWAAGGALAEGAWAVHGGRLAKVVYVNPNDGEVVVLYADDGASSDFLQPARIAPASPAQVAEGEAILADPGLPARRTSAWAAGGAPVRGAWALHAGRLCKVTLIVNDGEVLILNYADDGAASDYLQPAALAAAGPAQVAEGEAMLDALGAGPSSPLGRPLSPRAVWRMIS